MEVIVAAVGTMTFYDISLREIWLVIRHLAWIFDDEMRLPSGNDIMNYCGNLSVLIGNLLNFVSHFYSSNHG